MAIKISSAIRYRFLLAPAEVMSHMLYLSLLMNSWNHAKVRRAGNLWNLGLRKVDMFPGLCKKYTYFECYLETMFTIYFMNKMNKI